MLPIRAPAQRPSSPQDAARLDYVAMLHRYPFALDAYERGFVTGVREDYGLQEPAELATVDVPILMLDNDFRNPDLERVVATIREVEPRIAVVGDAEDRAAAERLRDRALTLADAIDGLTPVVVAKCPAALDVLPRDVVVGFPNGYSDVHGFDFATPADWAGHRVHVLGGSPPRQFEAIRRLTGHGEQRQLDAYAIADGAGDRADVVGVDWNGFHAVAYKGERWHHEAPHWRDADALSVRETIQRSLAEIRRYWKQRDLWPATTPADVYGPAIRDAEPRDVVDAVCHGCGQYLDPTAAETIEEAPDGQVYAYCSDRCAARVRRYRTTSIKRDVTGATAIR